jgi:hypothetical protein
MLRACSVLLESFFNDPDSNVVLLMELAKGDYNVLTKPPSKFGKNKKTVYMLKPNSIAITADNVNDEVSTNQMLRSIRWLSPREGLTGMTGVSTRPPGGALRQLRLRTPQRRQKRPRAELPDRHSVLSQTVLAGRWLLQPHPS